jgi:hypothetical protein
MRIRFWYFSGRHIKLFELGRADVVKIEKGTETSAANRDTQLTMDLEMKFRDELGRSYRLPSRRHFFEFATGRWIPALTGFDPTW